MRKRHREQQGCVRRHDVGCFKVQRVRCFLNTRFQNVILDRAPKLVSCDPKHGVICIKPTRVHLFHRDRMAVIRIPGPTVENRNANIYSNSLGGSATASSGVSTTHLGDYTDIRRRLITSSSSGGTLNLAFGAPVAGFAYTALVRLFPTSGGSVAGTVNVSILKNSTTLGSTTMTIPADGFQQWELSVSSSEFTGTEIVNLLFTGIDAGERFEMEFSFNAV